MSILGGATKRFVDEAFERETDDCIIWPYALDQKGYPQAQDAVGFYKPHRRICEMQNGPAPTSRHHAAHLCGNRPCINKRHLIWATPKENEGHKNIHGAITRGRRTLEDKDASSIRERFKSGEMMKDLAVEYGVSAKAISKIVHWQTYRDVR